MNCETCDSKHDGKYGSGRFCSTHCARSFATKKKRKEINEKVRKTLEGSGNPDVTLICVVCQKEFIRSFSKRYQKACSRSCGTRWSIHPDNPKKDEIHEARSKAARKRIQLQGNTRRSKNEMAFYDLCKEKWEDSLSNEPMFNGWDADVVIPSKKVAVLWNGIWHYKKVTKKHSLVQVQNRDAYKMKQIKEAGYICYVVKDLGKFDKEFVQNQFDIFVDWLKTK